MDAMAQSPLGAGIKFGDVQTPTAARDIHYSFAAKEIVMLKYGLAWLMGVPLGLLIVIYLIFHLL